MIKKLLFFLTVLTLLGLPAKAAEERKLLDVNLDISGSGNWNTTYYILLNEKNQLQVGDQLIVYAGGDQIQFGYIDSNCSTTPDKNNISYPGKESIDAGNIDFADNCFKMNNQYNSSNPARLVLNVNDNNKDILNQGGFRLKGQDFSIYYINFKAKDEDKGLTAKGGTNPDNLQSGSDSKDPNEPDQTTYEGTLLENPNNDKGLDLWMKWDDPQYYLVKFNQIFDEGDILIFESWVDNSGILKLAVNPGWDELYENSPGPKHEQVLSKVRANAINENGLYIQGDNYKVNKILYRGKNSVKAGGTIQKQIKDGALETIFTQNIDIDTSDESRQKDLMDSFGSMAVLRPDKWNSSNVKIEGYNFSSPATGSGHYCAGIVAQAIAHYEGTTLDNEAYNGSREEADQYKDDPLTSFNQWEYVVVELEEEVTGAEVAIFYRDLDYDKYISNITDEREFPEYFDFSGKRVVVPLDEYRYIRAIGVAIPANSTATISKFYLYERENYEEISHHKEIWVPGENNNDPAYEGHYLGKKQFYGQNKLEWDEGEGVEGIVEGWSTAIEIPGDFITKEATEKAEYQGFAIVYKDAEEVEGRNGGWEAPAQLQLYINFPFYQTDKEEGEWKQWIGKSWVNKEDSYKEDRDALIVDLLNKNAVNKAEAGEKAAYVPNIRNSHALVPLGADAKESDGSHYVQVPEEKEGIYTHAKVYIKTSKSIEYPVLDEEAQAVGNNAKRRVDSSTGVLTETGNIMDLAKEYGLAIRGQNLTIMKVVYLGAVGVQEEDVTELDVKIGTFNDYVDENNDQNVIRHAFSSDEITFEGLLNLNQNLIPDKDFKLNLVPKTTEAEWQTYNGTNHDNAYQNLFNQLEDVNAQSSLYAQYKTCGQNAKVDGFFTGNKDITISAERANNGNEYDYNVKVKVPCSGVYRLIFESLGEKDGQYNIVGETESEIIIYPNIVNKYGDEYGFNIDGYTFALKENSNELSKGDDGRYSIVLPTVVNDENGDKLYDYVIDRPLPTYFPGIYFANSVDHNGDVKNAKRRADAVAEAPGAENYCSSINLNALNEEGTTSVPVNVNITKNGATAKYIVNVSTGNEGSNTTTAVDTIGVESGEAVYFNLQGQKVANPGKGIYVKVQNGKATKVVI